MRQPGLPPYNNQCNEEKAIGEEKALWVSSVKGFSPAFKSQQVYRQVVSSLKVMEEVSPPLYDTSNHSICEVPAGLLCFTWVM